MPGRQQLPRVLSNRYELRLELGRGGMGTVWRATDRRLGRDVAVKLLHPWIAGDADVRRRFAREAEVLAKLSHPHIVRIYDFEEADPEDSYLVMELIEGRSLADVLSGDSRLSWPTTRAYIEPVFAALAYAHEHGIVHRDLTPANILIERQTERVVVSDFGIARLARAARTLTASGVVIGTPEYWSPEQAAGAETSGSTDVYAAGCIVFQALAGRLPFTGEDRLAIGLQRIGADAPAIESFVPDLPSDARTLANRLLAREPEERPTAAEAVQLLSDATSAPQAEDREPLAGAEAETIIRPDLAVTQVAPAREPSRRRRRPLLVALVVVAAAGLSAAIYFGASGAPPSAKGRDVAAPIAFTVPRLVGVTPDQAKKRVATAARKAGIAPPEVHVLGRVYSERYANGIIVSQAPRPRARRPAADVHQLNVRVSLGAATAPVPTVEGKPYRDATQVLGDAGFNPEWSWTPSTSVAEDFVISTKPAAGQPTRRPGPVTLLISSGKPRVHVPDVAPMSEANASSALRSRGFRYVVRYEGSLEYAPNQVISQVPVAGTVAEYGSTVTITVTREARWTKVYARYGEGTFQSPPIDVPKHWRIRWDVSALVATSCCWIEFDWGSEQFQGEPTSAGSPSDEPREYYPKQGAGTIQMTITPYGELAWYFAIEVAE